MEVIKILFVGLLILSLLSGCTGYIGGDLKNTVPSYNVPLCKRSERDYIVTIKDNAENDYCDQNIFGLVTAWTLGILPTFWMSFITSDVSVQDKNGIVYEYKFKSRIYKFYGIMWAFLLPRSELNSLDADEGAGLRVPGGVHSRVLTKISHKDIPGINIDNLCIAE